MFLGQEFHSQSILKLQKFIAPDPRWEPIFRLQINGRDHRMKRHVLEL